VPPLSPVRACALAAATGILLVNLAVAGWAASALPPEVPSPVRARLAPVTDKASLMSHVDGEPFRGRREVLEYLIDHPDFATHVTRTLKVARYRIWKVPGGFGIDDGWGVVGTFELVYAAPGIRVMHAQGEYQQRLLPDIHGQAVVSITYTTTPAGEGPTTIATAVGSVVKLDSKLLRAAGRLASSAAHAKADKEGKRLVKVFAKTTRAIDEDPAGLYRALRAQSDVPRQELEEFRRLLSLPSVAEPGTSARR
jgi:hypothetical protein